jgi:diguanylate cyclase (GGDEF)-like protein
MGTDLRDIDLLCGASEVLDVLSTCARRTLGQGQVLIEPGSLDRALYVLLAGGLAVHVDTLDQDPVAWIRPGQHTGEVALIDGLPRSAWVVAATPSEVLVVPEELFWDIVGRCPRVAINLLRSMAVHMRSGNEEVTEGRRLQAEYRRHASVDALTGLYNRRWLDEVLPRQVERAHGDGEPLSAVMVDIDHFKSFNDTWGHAAGDYVLFAVGRRLQRSFRPTDLTARYGGEEFTVILPRTREPDAIRAAECVRRAVATEPLVLEDGTVVKVTVSMGVGSLLAGQTAHELLQAADRALYRAKRGGRNQVVAWASSPC